MWTHTHRKPLLSFLFLSMFLLSAADASGLAPQKRRLPLLPGCNVGEDVQNLKKSISAAYAAEQKESAGALRLVRKQQSETSSQN